ncbi:calcium-binding protein [Methylobacterium sp. E-045]|uniref:calcium-binding protein n=1 Tax=Methylobacterium sp. E-045 TaxID=2836575 RepID=UPI001FB8C432|nr:calcium-binding protein [Methylobacterium sp. E-045]MCJ2127528.1 hypothetical protein [Methylobacterium sp. E-045]
MSANRYNLLDGTSDKGGEPDATTSASVSNTDATHQSSISNALGTVQNIYQLDSLPLSALGYVGEKIELSTLLENSFGTNSPQGFETYTLENLHDNQPKGAPGETETSYWGYNNAAQDSYWLVNGQKITSPVTIDASNIGDVELVVGNSMMNTVAFSVPVSEVGQDNTQLYRTYNIWTTQFKVMGAQFDSGNVDPIDIVTSAYQFNNEYPIWLNENNCNWIADDVAAAAGAAMPYDNYSDIPSQNVSGGFWRVVYRGDGPNGVQDWSTLTKPGDIVRMVWKDGSGHHTTTILGDPLADGSLPVYDNDLQTSTSSYIGIHHAWYWNETSVEGTTIFRLDPGHNYLIMGSDRGEILQGTIFNDLFKGGAGADTIDGSTGINTASYQQSFAGVNVNLTTNVNTGGDAAGDSLANIQKLIGSVHADSLTGDASANTLNGNGGNDALYGMAGNDRLIVTDTPATIDGGSGTDFLFVQGGGTILLAESAFQGIEAVYVRDNTKVDMSAVDVGERIVSTSTTGHVVEIIGTSGADRILAGKGNDTIDGGTGDDKLFAGSGADTFHFQVGFGRDNVYGLNAASDHIAIDIAGVDATDIQLTSFHGGQDTIVTFAGVEGTNKIILHDVTVVDVRAHINDLFTFGA